MMAADTIVIATGGITTLAGDSGALFDSKKDFVLDSTKSVVFSRCRPQKADPIDIVLRERRAFIGYPAWREGIERRQGHLREALIDFSVPDADWEALGPQLGNDRVAQIDRRTH